MLMIYINVNAKFGGQRSYGPFESHKTAWEHLESKGWERDRLLGNWYPKGSTNHSESRRYADVIAVEVEDPDSLPQA